MISFGTEKLLVKNKESTKTRDHLLKFCLSVNVSHVNYTSPYSYRNIYKYNKHDYLVRISDHSFRALILSAILSS